MENDKLSYWQNAKINELVQLSDEQTLSFLMGEGCKNIEHGADFTITRKRVIESSDDGANWLILDINFSDFVWFLVVRYSGEDFDIKVFYTPDNTAEGNRDNVIENDGQWMFAEPKDVDDFEVKDLEFTQEFTEGDEDIVYTLANREFGSCFEDGEESFATVVEYATEEDDVENPEIMFLEFNNMEKFSDQEQTEDEDGDIVIETSSGVNIDEENSFITSMQGCKVNLNDVKLLK